jgi:hypothetical protein
MFRDVRFVPMSRLAHVVDRDTHLVGLKSRPPLWDSTNDSIEVLASGVWSRVG